VSNIVCKTLEIQSEKGEDELEFQGVPSKYEVDSSANNGVGGVVPGHFVEKDESEYRAVTSVLLSNTLEFTLPHTFVSTKDFTNHISIDRLVKARSASVFESCELLVMASNMFVLEVDVENFG